MVNSSMEEKNKQNMKQQHLNLSIYFSLLIFSAIIMIIISMIPTQIEAFFIPSSSLEDDGFKYEMIYSSDDLSSPSLSESESQLNTIEKITIIDNKKNILIFNKTNNNASIKYEKESYSSDLNLKTTSTSSTTMATPTTTLPYYDPIYRKDLVDRPVRGTNRTLFEIIRKYQNVVKKIFDFSNSRRSKKHVKQ